jgi:putative lipoic acid-binding regulatory protein
MFTRSILSKSTRRLTRCQPSRTFLKKFPRASTSPNNNNIDDQIPHNDNVASSSEASETFRGFGTGKKTPRTPKSAADALTKSLGNLSAATGRNSTGKTNVVMGSDLSEESWRQLDSQVNEYPGYRSFKAIGFGGQDFATAMVACVENIVGRVHEECVSSRFSSGEKYISVTIGPVLIKDPQQVLEIYNLMSADGRLKFYI